jgi:hypothetical protein
MLVGNNSLSLCFLFFFFFLAQIFHCVFITITHMTFSENSNSQGCLCLHNLLSKCRFGHIVTHTHYLGEVYIIAPYITIPSLPHPTHILSTNSFPCHCMATPHRILHYHHHHLQLSLKIELFGHVDGITLFKPIVVLCGIDNFMQNIPHIQLSIIVLWGTNSIMQNISHIQLNARNILHNNIIPS